MFVASSYYKQSIGLTLIELMLALLIELSLFGVIISIYLMSQQSARLQSALTEIQENALLATSIITKDVKKAGYIGCARLTSHFVLPYANYSLEPQTRLRGDAHSVTLAFASFPSASLLQPIHGTSLIVSESPLFKPNDIAILSDCKHAEIVNVISAYQRQAKQYVQLSMLHYAYDATAELSPFIINHYYVEKTNRNNQAGLPIYALMKEDINHRKTELISGLSKLSLRYSVNDNAGLRELPASEIVDWSSVDGIQVVFELMSFPLTKSWIAYMTREVMR